MQWSTGGILRPPTVDMTFFEFIRAKPPWLLQQAGHVADEVTGVLLTDAGPPRSCVLDVLSVTVWSMIAKRVFGQAFATCPTAFAMREPTAITRSYFWAAKPSRFGT